MAGNARFESPSASSSEPGFSGTYSNGKRTTHSVSGGPNLDRSGSFREGAESRLFNSGISVSRSGNNSIVASGHFPSLSQCLSLDPISMGDRKVDRSVELRRVMGLFIGSTNEDNNSSGSSNLKPSPPMAVAEDLKRIRSSVADSCITARGRASKFDEHLNKLDKYCDGVISKKPQRNELVTNDQAGGLNAKIGTQIYRNPTEIVNQDRPKNVLLNKRVRTSVAETREFRNNSVRRQPVTMAKDRDSLKDNNGESEILEEKIQRLPAGGEGWDKKMKRKRSVGAVFTRPMDNNGDPKRNLQNKVSSEPGLQSSDTHPYRLGASNGTGNNKLDGTTNIPRARLSPRNEQDGPAVSRDITGGLNKERIVTKGNNKLNSRDDNYTPCASPLTKGKASRTPRNGATVAASSAPSTPRLSGTPEPWENTTGGSKISTNGGPTNRKRAMPAGSSSPSMAQWGSQRPQKMSRTRRANLVSPVSNQDEKQLSSDSCSDVSGRLMTSDGTNGGPVVVSKQFKVKTEVVVQSPHRMSESEESVGGEKEKGKGNGGTDTNANANAITNVNVNGNGNLIEGQSVVVASLPVGVKVKSVINEDSGEGVRRQGRSGRGPLIARATSSLNNGEKLDNGVMIKPVQRNRPGYEKNGSNKGRPLKKLSDRKGFSRLGHLQNGGSEFTGKSDDDREELLAAANHARNASYLACSSLFWKKMEPIFAPVSSKDRFYLSMQLKSEQDVQGNFSQFHSRENNVVVNFPNEERNTHVKHQGSESFSGRLDSDKTPKEFIPLFQRVLSALIIEENIDEIEEEEEDTGNILPNQDTFCDSAYEDYEPRKRARREFECDTVFGVHHAQSPHSVKVSFSISGCSNSFRSPSINDSPCEDVHSEVEVLGGISKDFIDRPQVLQMESFGISSFDNHQYEQMRVDDKLLLELQSIGLYPELVPNLDDKEDEAIKHEIDQLKIRLRQQNGKKKAYLEKICKGVGGSFVGRDLEQVAIDRLVELAHRKLLAATRGASRAGIPKVPKQVALAFGRRALARCRKFAKSGISCFNVPTLRDVLFAPQDHELEPTVSVANTTTTKYIGFQNPHQDSRLSSDEAFAINGPISNRGKKKELLLDDVGTVMGGKRCDQRKTKPKPKQKTAGLPMSGNGFGNQFTRSLHPVQPSVNVERRDVRMVSQESKEMMPLHELDPLDELGVGPELGGPQDLSALLNFDEEELQDQFTAGLDIPMDDLAELNMF